MNRYPYNSGDFHPPAPVLQVRISPPTSLLGMSVDALLDTGADMTVLPQDLINALRLPQVNEIYAVEALSQRSTLLPVFAAQVTTEFSASEIIQVIPSEKKYALLGRDMLNNWKVTLDGPQQLLDITV